MLRSTPLILILLLPIYMTGILSCQNDEESVSAETGFKPRKGIISVEGSSLRIAPSTLASKIDVLAKQLPVLVIGKTREKERVGSSRDFWYKIRLENNVEGWIYGAGLNFGDDEKAGKGPILPEEELKTRIVGKWWELVPGGGTGKNRIHIWPEGEYKTSLGLKQDKEGTYELDLENNLIRFSEGAPGGKELKFVLVGRELRLKGQRQNRDLFFARGDEDPGALEKEEEMESDSTEKNQSAPEVENVNE